MSFVEKIKDLKYLSSINNVMGRIKTTLAENNYLTDYMDTSISRSKYNFKK